MVIVKSAARKKSLAIDSAQIAKALADPVRARILKLIAACGRKSGRKNCDLPVVAKGVCVCDITDSLGMLQSRVSYHLKELKAAGLVQEETHGKWSYYSIRPAALRTYLTSLKREFGL